MCDAPGFLDRNSPVLPNTLCRTSVHGFFRSWLAAIGTEWIIANHQIKIVSKSGFNF
jgi:hypothetical protein